MIHKQWTDQTGLLRAPFQVLVMPFRSIAESSFEFAALLRSDNNCWQGVAGGGKPGERPNDAALRETREELGIRQPELFFRLDTIGSIPRELFSRTHHWSKRIFVIPEYCYAVNCTDFKERISDEHKKIIWGDFNAIQQQLYWDSNKTALWELRERLKQGALEPLNSDLALTLKHDLSRWD